MFYIKSFLLLVAHICRSTKMCRYTVSIVLLRSVMNNGDNEIKEKNGRASVPRPYKHSDPAYASGIVTRYARSQSVHECPRRKIGNYVVLSGT